MPVYNEQRALPATLECLLRQQGEYEVIVVDGGSCDGTRAIVAAEPRVRWVDAPKGRAAQMNAGARVAQGEWLLFLHADTWLPSGALLKLNRLEADATRETGGFRQRFSSGDWRLRLISGLHNSRCRWTKIFYGDQAMFVRRALFERVGGFPDVPIMEDVGLSEKLLKLTRPVLLRDYVITDARKFLQHGVCQ